MTVPELPFPCHLLWGIPNGMEWVIIAFIALLLFGNRLPGVARSMGRGITEFKRGLKDDGDDDGDGDGDGESDVAARKELPGQSSGTAPPSSEVGRETKTRSGDS